MPREHGLELEPAPSTDDVRVEMQGIPVSRPRPSWPELELELPPRVVTSAPIIDEVVPDSKQKPGLFRPPSREIVVEVGSKGSKGRKRRTFEPDALVASSDEREKKRRG